MEKAAARDLSEPRVAPLVYAPRAPPRPRSPPKPSPRAYAASLSPPGPVLSEGGWAIHLPPRNVPDNPIVV